MLSLDSALLSQGPLSFPPLRVSRFALTQAQYENLNTVPVVILAGTPGRVYLPLLVAIRLAVTAAYGGSSVLGVRLSAGGPTLVASATPDMTAIAVINSYMSGGSSGHSSLSEPDPAGADLLLTGSAAIAGGTIASCTGLIVYVDVAPV
jgi:hypothetical protein